MVSGSGDPAAATGYDVALLDRPTGQHFNQHSLLGGLFAEGLRALVRGGDDAAVRVGMTVHSELERST